MTEKHKNLLILLLSCSLLVCLIMMFALLPRDGGVKVEEPKKESENKVFESYDIYDGHDVGVVYAEEDNNCVSTDGRAIGDCYAEGLEDKRFLSYTESVSDIGPISYILLGTDGYLYYVDGAIAEFSPSFDGTKEKNPYGKDAEKIGFILSDETDECIYDHIYVVVVDGKEYLLDETGEELVDVYSKDHLVKYLYSSVCGERPDKGIGFNAYKNLLNVDKKIIKDKETKKEIIIDYVMYNDKDRKDLYIVGNDTLYLLNNENDEYASVVGKINKMHTTDESTGVFRDTSNITIELENGSIYAFIYNNK